MKRKMRPLLGLGLALTGMTAVADDLTGEDDFVCTAWHAVLCTTEGTCTPTEAWRLGMPDFVKVDLAAREIATPPGSDEQRATTLESVGRSEGRIVLNGWQGERGFTWVINEASGEGSMAIASDTSVITLFTACAATDNLR